MIINQNYKKDGVHENDLIAMKHWDIDKVISKRIQNARYLLKYIKNKNVFIFDKISPGDVPFFFPVYLKNRKEVCALLDKNNIFCSVLWQRPADCQEDCNLYDSEFGLVCDERYTLSDMKRMVDLLNVIL